MEFFRTLAALRKEKGLSQERVAAFLTARGCELTQRAVSKWERGSTQPNAEQFLLLCELYEVRDVLRAFCGLPAETGRLNALGRKRLAEYAQLLGDSASFSDVTVRKSDGPVRTIPLYTLPVSAGTGQFLDSEDYELLDADEAVPLSATFAVRLRGDSMTPRFQDGQIVYVHQQQALDRGEFGIFLLNGSAYCKRLAGGDLPVLESLNTHYPSLCVGPYDEFRVMGKIVE